MNFELKIQQLERDAESHLQQIEKIKADFESHKEFTQQFLDKCGEKGITKVAIRRKHKSIPQSMSFPFGEGFSVFSFAPEGARGINDWPLIWGVVDEMGISGGCKNGDQAQISNDKLIDGVYHLKAGVWQRIES